MSRILTALTVIVVMCSTMGFADGDLPSGFRGNVNGSDGKPAGTNFHTLHVERLDAQGTAGYSYYWWESRWKVNEDDSPPLVSGSWAIYAVTYESGTYYYSNWKCYLNYVSPSSTEAHTFNCTRTTPPPPLE